MPEQPLPAGAGSTGNHSATIESFRCDHCGLCCRQLLVYADWCDVLREPRIAQERPNRGASKTSVLEQYWLLYSKAKDGACPFLDADQKCGIYPTRPNTCVTFAAGSPKCQDLRARAGLPSLTAVPVVGRGEYPGEHPGASQDLSDRIYAAVIEYDREELL